MNPDQLLAHYEQVADAPDAVPRLRRFILDLAVRGKLVEQDPNDEPTAALLTRIETEKASLVKSGEIKNPKEFSGVDDEAPFGVPPTWRWTRLGIVTSYIQRGKSPKYTASDGAAVISQKCVQWIGLDLAVAKQVTPESLAKYEDIRFLRNGDLLWNSTGTGTIGRVIRIIDPPEKLVCDSHVTVVRCLEVDSEYIRTWLRSDHVYALIEGRASGSTNQVELTAQIANNQIVPLPPVAEQHRIVAKVEELMTLCDRLEAARATRETTRDRLAAASLARLSAPDPEPAIFQDHATFALDNLDPLTTRPDQIKAFRRTILYLAVRGKLILQDGNDEPASELLKRIAENKRSQVSAAEMKREERIQAIDSTNEPFSLRVNWVWASLRQLVLCLGDGLHGTPEYSASGKYHFINGNNLVNGKIVIKPTTKTVAESEFRKHKKPLKANTLLVAINGTLGNVALYEDENVVLGKSACYFDLTPKMDRRYVRWLIGSPYFEQYANENATGTTIKNLSLKAMSQFPVPVPPLAEQRRIVAKIDELMALCGQLEASLTVGDETRRRLLGTVLRRALEKPAMAAE